MYRPKVGDKIEWGREFGVITMGTVVAVHGNSDMVDIEWDVGQGITCTSDSHNIAVFGKLLRWHHVRKLWIGG